MQLALKKTASSNATLLQRLCAAAIRWRLVSQYCHGGIVINGEMYHATALAGLHKSAFEPSKWQLYELGNTYDAYVLRQFSRFKDAPYDKWGILGFELPFNFGKKDSFYCFEWCNFAMLGDRRTVRVTAELLLTRLLNDVRFNNNQRTTSE